MWLEDVPEVAAEDARGQEARRRQAGAGRVDGFGRGPGRGAVIIQKHGREARVSDGRGEVRVVRDERPQVLRARLDEPLAAAARDRRVLPDARERVAARGAAGRAGLGRTKSRARNTSPGRGRKTNARMRAATPAGSAWRSSYSTRSAGQPVAFADRRSRA